MTNTHPHNLIIEGHEPRDRCFFSGSYGEAIYRALAEHDKRQRYPEVIEQAHADFAALQAGT